MDVSKITPLTTIVRKLAKWIHSGCMIQQIKRKRKKNFTCFVFHFTTDKTEIMQFG